MLDIKDDVFMNKIEQIKYAKDFIKKLGQGINPINNEVIDSDDLINNIRVSRCMFFVADILEEIIRKEETDCRISSNTIKPVEKFVFNNNMLTEFNYSDQDMYLTEFVEGVKELSVKYGIGILPRRAFVNWLLSSKIYEIQETTVNGKVQARKRATQAGSEVGIYNAIKNSAYGPRDVILISRKGQEFLMDNLPSIAEHFYATCKVKMAPANSGARWTTEEEKVMIEMYTSGIKISEIAKRLQRKRGGVRARLKKLGYLNSR